MKGKTFRVTMSVSGELKEAIGEYAKFNSVSFASAQQQLVLFGLYATNLVREKGEIIHRDEKGEEKIIADSQGIFLPRKLK